jgi:AraC-like DNA-binding protein
LTFHDNRLTLRAMNSGSRMRAGGVAGVAEAIVARGGSLERVLAAAGLRPKDLADPDHMVDLEKLLVFLDAAAREVRDDTLLLKLGLTYDPNLLGVLAYAVLNAPTVGTALRNLERYAHTLMHGAEVTIEIDGDTCALRYDLRVGDRALRRQNAEGACAIAFQLLRRMIGADWRPRRVLFGHPAPADITEHRRVFSAPITFDAEPSFAILFDVAELARPVAGADQRLLPIVQRYLDEASAPAEQNDAWLREVRALIARAVCDGHPSVERIARVIGLGARTLQRRLADRGLVWKALVEDVRHELALRYLAERSSSLTEIAFLLGYSELSAFDRAFRRWTGTTPAAYRRRLQAEAGVETNVV